MQTESAPRAPGESYAGVPTGFRRLTPSLLAADHAAEGFNGLPDGVTLHGQLLAAFKAAAPRLGLSPRLVHAIDWLFKFTQPQDWGRGGHPIVWPSASLQQDALGLSATRVKALNRALIEAGLVTMRDSPNGKRYGRRDLKDRRIRSNVVSPGPINTPMVNRQSPDVIARIVSTIPMGRMGEPEEVDKVALFLASDDSSFVTGIELFVDGGRAQI